MMPYHCVVTVTSRSPMQHSCKATWAAGFAIASYQVHNPNRLDHQMICSAVPLRSDAYAKACELTMDYGKARPLRLMLTQSTVCIMTDALHLTQLANNPTACQLQCDETMRHVDTHLHIKTQHPDPSTYRSSLL